MLVQGGQPPCLLRTSVVDVLLDEHKGDALEDMDTDEGKDSLKKVSIKNTKYFLLQRMQSKWVQQ